MVWTRIRDNAILLSHAGQSIKMIASIYGVCRQTIAIWLKNWTRDGLCRLIDQSGRGGRKKLPIEVDL